MRKLLAILLMAVAASFAAAEFSNPLGTGLFNELGGVVAAVLMLGVVMVALVYMVGSFLMNDKVKGWAKAEAVELFYSGVILALIVSLVAMGDSVASSFAYEFDGYSANMVCNGDIPAFNTFIITHPDGSTEPVDPGYAMLPCHIRIAKNFLASIFYETAGFVKAVGVTHSWYTFLSSFSFDFTPVGTTTFFSGAMFNHSIFGFLNAKNNALSFLFDNGIKVLTLVRFQEVLMNFIGTALFPVLLSVGLVLRTFTLTRKLGGLLMAIALCIYFIYPSFYMMGDAVYNSVKLAQNYPPGTQEKDKTALAAIFLDFSAMPPKLNNQVSWADEQANIGVNTDATKVSRDFMAQLGLLTATDTCDKTLDQLNSPPANGFLDKFKSENTLLGTWLAEAFNKGTPSIPVLGSVYGTGSFGSILVGIDVLAKAVFFSAFFSFLSIFATIAGIKTLSPMLGGDTEIAGLTHLI